MTGSEDSLLFDYIDVHLSATCPVHPGEIRDPFFALLDRLIELGWGAVPRHKIEGLVLQHGRLPDEPPSGYRDGVNKAEHRERIRAGQIAAAAKLAAKRRLS